MWGLCIFEDKGYTDLLPLTYNRAVYELRCGISTLLEKVLHCHPNTRVSLFCRDYLANTLRERHPYNINTLDKDAEGYLFINGRAIDARDIPLEGEEEIGMCGDTIIYARLEEKNYRSLSADSFLKDTPLLEERKRVKVVEVKARLINYFWDIVKNNVEELRGDFERLQQGGFICCKVTEGVHLLNPQGIFLGKNSVIKPGCVLDAEKGPIYVGEDALLMPNATLIGPAFIGRGAVVQPCSRLRAGSNIGEGCKVGGEVVNSILHSYSNKQHDGFLGDSYIGSWVNIGAGTTNSNLKNTYGNIRVQLGEKMIDSGETFLGVVIGDHTKVGINSSFSAGSVVGFCCNVVGRYPVPRFIPSFSWCAERIQEYHLDNALEVARRTMARREKPLPEAEEALFRKVYDLTQMVRGRTPYI